MEKPRVSAIAAIGKNNELGKDNELLWRIPEDFERMRALTKGHALIMGRKTHESIGRPLPDRANIVITSDENYEPDGCIVVHSLEAALEEAAKYEEKNDDKEVFIFGGSKVYEDALPHTDRLYLTTIEEGRDDADTYFPTYDEFKTVIEEEKREHEGIDYTFITLER